MNCFGELFRLTSFGESHGKSVGGVIDGMPAGVKINIDEIQHQLDRRKPGQSQITTLRHEDDNVAILSGLYDDVTTGAPIGFVIDNTNFKSSDYDNLRNVYRPSHADYTYSLKYGIRDHRGGGRASARETSTRIVAGEIARQALNGVGIKIYAYTSQIGDIATDCDYRIYDPSLIDSNIVRCPDMEKAKEMQELISRVRNDGDTLGGVVTCVIKYCPIGLGDPVFDKLHARLGYAMLSINAVKGFEYGMGFSGVSRRGSEMNDLFYSDKGKISVRTNHSGGIQGGISNGEDIYFRVAFKPIATLMRDVDTVDNKGHNVRLKLTGRHDTCAVPRAVPIVEAMAAMTVFDMYLLNRSSRI